MFRLKYTYFTEWFCHKDGSKFWAVFGSSLPLVNLQLCFPPENSMKAKVPSFSNIPIKMYFLGAEGPMVITLN